MAAYLKNLINKTFSSKGVVQPRLKGKFEGDFSSSLSQGENPKEKVSTPNFNKIDLKESSDSIHSERGLSIKSRSENEINSEERKQTTEPLKSQTTNNADIPTRESRQSSKPENPEVRKLSETITQREKVIVHELEDFQKKDKLERGILNQEMTIPSRQMNFQNDASLFRESAKEKGDARPTVKISIGRIEVRAVKETKKIPSAKRPKPGPRMTLDDYLKKREG